MRSRRMIVVSGVLVLVLGLLVGPNAAAGPGPSVKGPAVGYDNSGPKGLKAPRSTNGPAIPLVFNATDWFVSSQLAAGTDTPFQEIQAEGASFPFITAVATGNSNAGFSMDNTAGAFNCIYSEDTSGDLVFDRNCVGPQMRIASDGQVGIGPSVPDTRLHVGPGGVNPVTAGASLMVQEGVASSMILKSTAGPESFFYQDQNNGLFGTASATPMGIRTANENRVWITAGGLIGINTTAPTSSLTVNGSLNVTGAKSFVQENPENPKQNIVYAALEGPEAGTYTRGSSELVNGQATVRLPKHFGLVTERESLTVQLTPRGSWNQLFVVSLTPTKLVVRSASGKTGEFDFLIQGVRKGFKNFKVLRGKHEIVR